MGAAVVSAPEATAEGIGGWDNGGWPSREHY